MPCLGKCSLIVRSVLRPRMAACVRAAEAHSCLQRHNVRSTETRSRELGAPDAGCCSWRWRPESTGADGAQVLGMVLVSL